MKKISLLIVDDEPSILKVVQHVMQAAIDCDVTTSLSGEQALRLLEQKRFDVIVSDVSMPGMDGATLVGVVSELYPETMRLIFSGRSGGEIGLRTAGSAHQFFLKPTDLILIAKRIENVLKLREGLSSGGMDRIVSNIKSLPSIPAVYLALEEELKKNAASMDNVGKIVERDIALSAKVLHLVNSAFFGMRERVTRPAQAAVLLGGDVLKSLLLGLHIFTEWTKRQVPFFSMQELWSHSLNVATRSQEIAMVEKCKKERCDEMFVAGLFHDIGKIIIADNLPESCALIQKLVNDAKLTLLEAEREVLGATHAEAGAYLMALWGFSDHVVNACAFHHSPSRFAEHGFNEVCSVHISNVFDYENELGNKPASAIFDKAYLTREGFEGKLESWRKPGIKLLQEDRQREMIR